MHELLTEIALKMTLELMIEHARKNPHIVALIHGIRNALFNLMM